MYAVHHAFPVAQTSQTKILSRTDLRPPIQKFTLSETFLISGCHSISKLRGPQKQKHTHTHTHTVFHPHAPVYTHTHRHTRTHSIVLTSRMVQNQIPNVRLKKRSPLYIQLSFHLQIQGTSRTGVHTHTHTPLYLVREFLDLGHHLVDAVGVDNTQDEAEGGDDDSDDGVHGDVSSGLPEDVIQ